jgi:hypothetical protein
MRTSSTKSWLPPVATAARLFGVGATVGPIVDSLHNQVLLEYHIAPISIDWPLPSVVVTSAASALPDVAATALLDLGHPISHNHYLFCSSWVVPPLLGVAYVVLGGILPRILQNGMDIILARRSNDKNNASHSSNHKVNPTTTTDSDVDAKFLSNLQARAILAVLSTAAIIQLSDYLVTHTDAVANILSSVGWTFAGPLEGGIDLPLLLFLNVVVMLLVALLQWAILDGTAAALLAASVASVAGPLAELPFVALDAWQYLPEAADYFPLETLFLLLDHKVPQPLEVFNHLGLSSITGPCYFAVTMDAIALGRWFDGIASTERDGSQESM